MLHLIMKPEEVAVFVCMHNWIEKKLVPEAIDSSNGWFYLTQRTWEREMPRLPKRRRCLILNRLKEAKYIKWETRTMQNLETGKISGESWVKFRWDRIAAAIEEELAMSLDERLEEQDFNRGNHE